MKWQEISLTVIEKVQIAAAILGSLFLIASISWLVWSSLSPSAKWQRQDLLFQICYGMYGFMDVICIGMYSLLGVKGQVRFIVRSVRIFYVVFFCTCFTGKENLHSGCYLSTMNTFKFTENFFREIHRKYVCLKAEILDILSVINYLITKTRHTSNDLL